MSIVMHADGILIALVAVLPCFGQGDVLDPVRRARCRTSEAETTITGWRRPGQHERSMKLWSEGNDLALVLNTERAEEKDIAFDKSLTKRF